MAWQPGAASQHARLRAARVDLGQKSSRCLMQVITICTNLRLRERIKTAAHARVGPNQPLIKVPVEEKVKS
jgi:hypothetical protein